MAEVDLDRLEALAKAVGGGLAHDQMAGDPLAAFIHDCDEFQAATDSSTVLALISRLRKAEADAARWHHVQERSAELAAQFPNQPEE